MVTLELLGASVPGEPVGASTVNAPSVPLKALVSVRAEPRM
jgi:hypothetical protein